MRKYDVYLGNFDPRKGSAQSGIRPCIIVQSNVLNDVIPTVLVVPLTSVIKKIFPSEFLITPSKENGLTEPSRFLGAQLTALDKRFLGKRLGCLETTYYPLATQALSVVLDPEDEFKDEEHPML